jgi:hypothetical protein
MRIVATTPDTGGQFRVYPSFGAANPSGLASAANERLDDMRPEEFAPNAIYTRQFLELELGAIMC